MKISGFSDMGVSRNSNQDAFYVKEGKYAIVADGMGGHNGGEIASNTTVTAIRTHLDQMIVNSETNILEELKVAVQLANEIVFDMGKDSLDGMGTTVVIAYVYEKVAYIASVGDSRVYFLRDDKMQQITTDHTIVNSLIEIGRITENQATNHPQKNLLTRAVGTDEDVEIDTFVMQLEKGDVLLLCTDGLTNAISDFEVAELIKANVVAEDLCLIASKRSGKDNCTVVLMEV